MIHEYGNNITINTATTTDTIIDNAGPPRHSMCLARASLVLGPFRALYHAARLKLTLRWAWKFLWCTWYVLVDRVNWVTWVR